MKGKKNQPGRVPPHPSAPVKTKAEKPVQPKTNPAIPPQGKPGTLSRADVIITMVLIILVVLFTLSALVRG